MADELLDESGEWLLSEDGGVLLLESEESELSNVLTTPGVLTIDTAAVLHATNIYKLGVIVYAAPAAAIGACTLEDGAGNLILTLRAPVSGTVQVDLGGKEFVGLEVASITASSNLTIIGE
jgi:hypothetical protein